MQRNHIHIPLCQNQLFTAIVFGKIHGKKAAAFMIHRCIGSIDIFGLFVGEDTPAKRNHISPQINDRKHDAAMKAIHDTPVAGTKRNVRLYQFIFRIFHTLQVVAQRKTACG